MLLYTQHVVEILHGLAGSAFSKIVEARDEDQAASRLVQCESDVAKISVRDVLQFGQRASGPDANQGTPGVELAVERLDIRGGLRLVEGNVNGGENSTSQRQQVGRENNLRLAQTGMFENLRCVTVGEKPVGLEIFIHLNKFVWVRGRSARMTLVA